MVIYNGQRLRADVLLSQALVVEENKNEMKSISELLLFVYQGDSEFISQEILRF